MAQMVVVNGQKYISRCDTIVHLAVSGEVPMLEGRGFDSWGLLGSLLGSLQVVQLPPTHKNMHVRSIGNSK